jgi:hypothetical protein
MNRACDKTNKEKGSNMRVHEIEIEGLQPLLMHNGNGMRIENGGKVRRIPSPEEEAKAGEYRLPNGDLGVPTIALRKCLLLASKPWKVEKTRLITLLYAHMQILPFDGMVPLLREGQPIREYGIDTRRAVPRAQGAVSRSRPLIRLPWSLVFQVTWNDDILPRTFSETLAAIVQTAGQGIGLLDYRPEKGGWFGQFQLVRMEEVTVGTLARADRGELAGVA